MTNPTPIAAGYIVTNNEGIFATSDTAVGAWEAFLGEMSDGNITVVFENEEAADVVGDWTNVRDYTVRAASQALLTEIHLRGGAIGWHMVGGVACTKDEAEAE